MSSFQPAKSRCAEACLKGNLFRKAFPATLALGVAPSLIFLHHSSLLWNFYTDLLLVIHSVFLLSVLVLDKSLAPRKVKCSKLVVQRINGMELRQNQNDELDQLSNFAWLYFTLKYTRKHTHNTHACSRNDKPTYLVCYKIYNLNN